MNNMIMLWSIELQNIILSILTITIKECVVDAEKQELIENTLTCNKGTYEFFDCNAWSCMGYVRCICDLYR